MSNIWTEHPTNRRDSEHITEYGVVDALRIKKQLTERELEILRLCADGYSSPEIAEKLHLAEETIKGYRKRIIYKMRVRNITHAAVVGIRLGIID